MNYIQLFNIFGGLGLFIFGMKLMSEALQKASSSNIRNILAKMTKNRFRGILSGTLITSLIQSSSGTTVMIVSLVNAGLLTLTESISVIMGANIGTTMTAWIVSILGFKVKIAIFALPAIAIGALIYFFKGTKNKNWAEVLIGFGLLFLGLNYMKDGVPPINEHPEFFEFLNNYSGHGYVSLLLFVLIGTILTVILQSSSATMALTITIAMKGWIPFESAAAMVLGENLGTTITAILASLPANKMAKRSALSHTMFNVFGIIWMSIVFWGFLHIVDMLWPGNPTKDIDSVRFHLSLFHTMFNLTNTLLLVWFVPFIAYIVTKLIKIEEGEEQYHLKFIGTGLHTTPELRVIEAQKELERMGHIVYEMYKDTIEVVLTPHKKMGKIIDKINKYETITDMLEKEISDFLSYLMQSGISNESADKISSYFHIVNDLERIGDHCTLLIKLAQRRYEKQITFTDKMFKELEKIGKYAKDFLKLIKNNLNFTPINDLIQKSIFLENKINALRDNIKKEHTKLLRKGKEKVNSGLVLMDMINNLEKIGDHSFNISQALTGEK